MALPPKLVCLDAVGTLIYPRPPAHQAYWDAAQAFGCPLTPEDISVRFRQALAAAPPGPTSEAGERSYWQGVVRHVFAEWSDCHHSLFERLWYHFAEPSSWEVYADVEVAWRLLERRGVSVAVASNFDQRLLNILRAKRLLSECRHAFTSAQVGYRKSSPQFYRRVSGYMDVPPERCLMIGDDWHCDVASASAAGWRAIWLCRTGRPPSPDDSVFTVSGLVAAAGAIGGEPLDRVAD